KSTDTESSCSFLLLIKENKTDYEIKDNKQSNNSNNNIKQYELDYKTVKEMLKNNSKDILNLLEVCSNHFNFGQDRLYSHGSKAFLSWKIYLLLLEYFKLEYTDSMSEHKKDDYFFQRQGRGAESFNCKKLHVDNSSKTLELLEN
ncbi:19200_t:CDS:2, partial [Racocetra persica]